MARQVFQSRSRARGAFVRAVSILPVAVLAGFVIVVIAAGLAPSGSSLVVPPFVAALIRTAAPVASSAAPAIPTSSGQPSAPSPSIGAGANETVTTAIFQAPSLHGATAPPTSAPAPTTTQPAAVPTTQPTAAPTAHGQSPATFPGRTPAPR